MSWIRSAELFVKAHPFWVATGVLGALGLYTVWRRSYQDFDEEYVGEPSCMGGVRDLGKVRLIVLHSTESDDSGGARNVASWFAQPSISPGYPGSVQLVVGPQGEVYRSVPDDRMPCGAVEANKDGLHVEIVGYAKWSREDWLSRTDQLRRVRDVVRKWSRMYGIPLVALTDEELRSGASGVTTHAQLSRVYSGGVGHWDPGTGFPIDRVL